MAAVYEYQLWPCGVDTIRDDNGNDNEKEDDGERDGEGGVLMATTETDRYTTTVIERGFNSTAVVYRGVAARSVGR